MVKTRIPEGWEEVDLSKVPYVKGKSNTSYKQGGVIYLSPEYLREGIKPLFISEFSKCVFTNDDETILLWDGSNAGELFKSKKGILASTMVKFTINNKDFDNLFFYYSLKYHEEKIKSETRGSGIPHVDKSTLSKLRYIKPTTLSEQKRIAVILQIIDNAIDKTKELIEKNKKIKQGLMRDLVTKLIADNCEIVYVKNICKLRRGASPRPIDDPSYFADSGRGWIRISDVTAAYKYLEKTTQYLSRLGESLSVTVEPGNLIMSICATIGRPVIVKIKACIHDGFVFFDELSQEINTEYLFYYLQSKEIEINKDRQTGTQGNLNTDIVNAITVPKPKIGEQIRIAKILSSVDKKIQSEENYLNKLTQMKSGLMQDLLTGRVRVKVEAS